VPELPEVETIRRDLAPLVAGRRIEAVEVDPGTIHLLSDLSLGDLRSALVGRRIESLGRRGKYLLFELDDGQALVVHLRMTGRLVWRAADAPPEPYERARIVLDASSPLSLDEGEGSGVRVHHLRWSDLRKFGTWRVVGDPEAYLAKRLGPEPIDAAFSFAAFRAAVQGRSASMSIKAVLLDQRRMAGLGNIYVDEALFAARIRPATPANGVSAQALKRLWEATRRVLEQGIENRGASFKDYVDGQGNQGSQHMHVQVFRRTGKPCYACGTPISRTVVAGRGTHFCPRCQPARRRRHED